MLRRLLAVALLGTAVAFTAPAAQAASPAGHWPKNLKRPKIAGSAVAGNTLKASHGSWSRSSARRPSSYTYSWLRCRAGGGHCRVIKGAHKRRFTVRTKDVGRRLRVRVTAVRHIGPAGHRLTLRVSARSKATKVVRSATTGGTPGSGGLPGGGTPGGGTPGGGTPGGGPIAAPGLHVAGSKLLDGKGNTVHLHGVNYSGTEFACIQGWGIFDGPSDEASVVAIRSWNANVVHLGLNEDCILGINGVKPEYAGANYMKAITDYVDLLHKHNMYAEISLMWAAPGSTKAEDHPPILDADHAGDALKAIGNAFKDDPNTFIGLQSEPHDISWPCWRDGTSCGVGYTALGMQGALDAVRSTGATNVVTASGIDYANNLSQWLANKPSDPLNQLMAEAHIYGGNGCSDVACFNSQLAPVAAQVPLQFGETGEHYDGNDCGSTNTATFLTWADAHGVGYQPWQWNPWGTCLDLTSNPDGTVANSDYARYVHSHFAGLPD